MGSEGEGILHRRRGPSATGRTCPCTRARPPRPAPTPTPARGRNGETRESAARAPRTACAAHLAGLRIELAQEGAVEHLVVELRPCISFNGRSVDKSDIALWQHNNPVCLHSVKGQIRGAVGAIQKRVCKLQIEQNRTGASCGQHCFGAPPAQNQFHSVSICLAHLSTTSQPILVR